MTDPGAIALEHAAVDLVLAIFVGEVVDVGGEEELGSIQPDAFGAGVAGGGQIVGKLDVRVEPNRGRRRRSRPVRARSPSTPAAGRRSSRVLGGARELLRRRIEDQLRSPMPSMTTS